MVIVGQNSTTPQTADSGYSPGTQRSYFSRISYSGRMTKTREKIHKIASKTGREKIPETVLIPRIYSPEDNAYDQKQSENIHLNQSISLQTNSAQYGFSGLNQKTGTGASHSPMSRDFHTPRPERLQHSGCAHCVFFHIIHSVLYDICLQFVVTAA